MYTSYLYIYETLGGTHLFANIEIVTRLTDVNMFLKNPLSTPAYQGDSAANLGHKRRKFWLKVESYFASP